MIARQNFQRYGRLICALVLLAGPAGLWWLCARNPGIVFLTQRAPAEWIVYPMPVDASELPVVEINSVFRKTFTLDQAPSRALLEARAFRRMAIRINGSAVESPAETGGNWKEPSRFQVAGLLHPGTNELVVTVFSSNSLPALWLALEAGGAKLSTGPDWEASLEGAAWRPVRLATQPLSVEKGSRLYGGENATAALRKQFPALLLFAVLAAACVGCGLRWLRRNHVVVRGAPAARVPSSPARRRLSITDFLHAKWRGKMGRSNGFGEPPNPAGRRPALAAPNAWFQLGRNGEPADGSRYSAKLAIGAVAALTIGWLALFLNNRTQLPGTLGFDAKAHLAYIDFIRTRHALPYATDGWEMYQPPLYYLIAAAIISPFKAATDSDAAIQVFRGLGMVVEIFQIGLVFLCLRLLFPRQLGKQLFGIILAALLPVQMYLSQYVTNECLLPLWVTASIYFCLRMVIEDRDSWRLALGLGLGLGAALLTKITALLAAPSLFGALIGWLVWKRRRDARVWLRTVGVVILATLVVSGWHYARVWHHFGNPLVQNWDATSGFAWWSDPGFQTGSYFTRFGESLAQPFFSAFYSFADGIYSTVWGDGFFAGRVVLDYRAPWNYEPMAAGYWLALFPTAIILTGAFVTVARLIRRPDPVAFILVGLPATTLGALVYMALKLPFCVGVKAFYGLLVILPVCALGAVGWGVVTKKARSLAPVLYVAVGVWALNTYSTFWIREGSSRTHTTRGLYLSMENRGPEALQQFSEALQMDPHNVTANRALAGELFARNRLDDAQASLARALQDAPQDGQTLIEYATLLAARGNLEEAVKHADAAVKLAPDLAIGYKRLALWRLMLGRNAGAVSAGREGLRVHPLDAELQQLTGSAFAAQSDHAEAVKYFNYALELNPAFAEAHDRLGLSLQALDRRAEATRQFIEAARLKPGQIAFRLHLAAVLELAGQTAPTIKA